MTTNPGVFKVGDKIYTSTNIKKKVDRMKINYNDVVILEEILDNVNNVDKHLAKFESKYHTINIKKGFKELKFYLPKKFYFYQKYKNTYLASSQYYPKDSPYFNIPLEETLKTLIEKGDVIMSDNEERIKYYLEQWINRSY